ncbi:MAG: NAD(P)-dependent oxidoreductase [bacterium]
MAQRLPTILVTGASGFIGRNFLDAVKDDFRIYAVARRSEESADIRPHPNIIWIQADISDWSMLKAITSNIKEQGGADFILHLAGFYDFTYEDDPEYLNTNVNGTRHLLELGKWLCVRRFVFASSLAACPFPEEGEYITEDTPCFDEFPYSWSKRVGEEMCEQYSAWFPCTIVRFAAVFSDWGEYAPLYSFLRTWLSSRWDNRILGGKGQSSVPYIHVDDVCRMLVKIFRMSDRLPVFDTYHATPKGSTTHNELFRAANRYYRGRPRKPIHIPRLLAYPGMVIRELFGQLIGSRPFERLWMLRYVDLRLDADNTHTREMLDWEPRPRLHILRRLLFLVARMVSQPELWRLKNEAAMKRVSVRSSFLVYQVLDGRKEELLDQFLAIVRNPAHANLYPNYQGLSPEDLRRYTRTFYDLLLTALRTEERTMILNYIEELVPHRAAASFDAAELKRYLSTLHDLMVSYAREDERLVEREEDIHLHITMTLQLAKDHVEHLFEQIREQSRGMVEEEVDEAEMREDLIGPMEDLERLLDQLNIFYRQPDEDEEDSEGVAEVKS